MKKGFFVYSEKYERTVVRHKTKRTTLNPVCETCGESVEWLTLEEVSAATENTTKEICRMIADGDLHFQEAKNKYLFICGNSIKKDKS